jgi:chemotaxis protein CheD
MIPYDTNLPVVYLRPGQIYVADKPTVVSTLLGSCVSITLFNRALRWGAICHGILPACKKKKRGNCNQECKELYKYIDCAFRHMVLLSRSCALNHEETEVKLFGGAGMLTPHKNRHGIMSVGDQNIRMALRLIKSEGFNILASDTGGNSGRKLFFLTHTGDVYLKRLNKTEEVGLR